ncbi:hypothetical protein FQP85_03225 [Pseudoalteromonas neustonica]|uniref:Uncharacterized protein n=1 Tax=Pseudoalteromonas neustonica TaxID=1840331 RepID=A0ABY3FIK1_9GAMM|nr:hypothetical protein [Pseudoalteromonas neustonica]TVU86102.1 hypothetical protein FQP85_03225 [Pseudoalteromonas neustonica]
MSKNLKETATNILKQSNRNPAIYSIFIAIFGCGFFVYEFFNSFSFNLNTPIENWVATASYFNNVFSPILLFVSILLLYRTWKDSKEALEIQKLELVETRIVLKEQSDTQSFSVLKEAFFQVIDRIDNLYKKECILKHDEEKWSLVIEGQWNFKSENLNKNESKMSFETFLQSYFVEMQLELDEQSLSYKNLIFESSFDYIEKVKTVALLSRNMEGNQYKPILEIIVFHRLTIFAWLFFVEISYHLFKFTQDKEKEAAELVFAEIAGLTCRQLKELYWINSLSDEVLLELKERKLL